MKSVVVPYHDVVVGCCAEFSKGIKNLLFVGCNMLYSGEYRPESYDKNKKTTRVYQVAKRMGPYESRAHLTKLHILSGPSISA